MKIQEFSIKVRDAVGKMLGSEYRVEVKEVRKNNGILLHGLLISSNRENVIPTIYLETFYAAYEDGVTFSEIVGKIIDIYREETPRGNINMDFFKHFEQVKDRICYKLIRRLGNEELLQEIPYVEFLDLAICFYYAYSGMALGEGTILIHNSHMEYWGTKIQELMRLAAENTPRLFPDRISSMTEVLEEIMDVSGCEELEQEIPMTVLSNEKRIHGAACILYPGMLEKIAKKLKKSFYILPSSVHEVILLKEREGEVPVELKRMICEINSTQVSAEEVLSDSLYFYDYSSKKVKIIF